MPAVNPRITITLKPQTHAALQRMSALAGNSMSAIVGELLEQSQPVFDRMVRLLEAAQKIKDNAKEERERIAKGLEEAQTNLEKQLGLSLEWMDEASAPVLEAAEKLERRAGRGERKALPRTRTAQPARRPAPLSNRGVTPRENPETVVEVKAKKRVASSTSGVTKMGAKTRKATA